MLSQISLIETIFVVAIEIDNTGTIKVARSRTT